MVFNRNNQVEGARNQKKMNLSIFTSTKVNGIWSKPIELFVSNNEFSFCHPSLNNAGDRLYFSSNMPGGYGNYDLYFIEKVTGIWSSPINVGSVVNTGDNELFPNLDVTTLLKLQSGKYKLVKYTNTNGDDFYFGGQGNVSMDNFEFVLKLDKQ